MSNRAQIAREDVIPDLFELFLCVRGMIFIGMVLRGG
jgi:hypothetical protein